LASDPREIPPSFALRCGKSIQTMRRAGLNDIQIACILQDARSCALSEEFTRLQELVRQNPPKHHPHGEMAGLIGAWVPVDGAC
jgi:hypothetical protein